MTVTLKAEGGLFLADGKEHKVSATMTNGDGFTVEPTNLFGGVAAIVTKDGAAEMELTPENVDDQPIPPAAEMQFSRKLDSQFMDAADKANKKAKNVDLDVMAQARTDREKIRAMLEDIADMLPDDIEGNTFYTDSSYGGTEEHTTICPRTMAYEEFMDAIAEELGRPLTVEDTVFISQEAMALTDKPECLYCYVAMDRKAYREYLGKYIEQRDAFLADVKSGMEIGLVKPVAEGSGSGCKRKRAPRGTGPRGAPACSFPLRSGRRPRRGTNGCTNRRKAV